MFNCLSFIFPNFFQQTYSSDDVVKKILEVYINPFPKKTHEKLQTVIKTYSIHLTLLKRFATAILKYTQPVQ